MERNGIELFLPVDKVVGFFARPVVIKYGIYIIEHANRIRKTCKRKRDWVFKFKRFNTVGCKQLFANHIKAIRDVKRIINPGIDYLLIFE